MSTMTEVNPQITDSITRTNPSNTNNAAAFALAYLYQVTACALGNAAPNAISSQQQSNASAQAATNMGVVHIYSIDTPGSAATHDDGKSPDVSPAVMAAALPDASAHMAQAAVLQNTHGLDNAGPWCHAAKELMGTVAGALRDFQKVARENDMAIVKQAAITAVLAHIIKAPDQMEQYQKILKLIEEL